MDRIVDVRLRVPEGFRFAEAHVKDDGNNYKPASIVSILEQPKGYRLPHLTEGAIRGARLDDLEWPDRDRAKEAADPDDRVAIAPAIEFDQLRASVRDAFRQLQTIRGAAHTADDRIDHLEALGKALQMDLRDAVLQINERIKKLSDQLDAVNRQDQRMVTLPPGGSWSSPPANRYDPTKTYRAPSGRLVTNMQRTESGWTGEDGDSTVWHFYEKGDVSGLPDPTPIDDVRPYRGGFINIWAKDQYPGRRVGPRMYATRKEAEEAARGDTGRRIACIEIHDFFEGDGL